MKSAPTIRQAPEPTGPKIEALVIMETGHHHFMDRRFGTTAKVIASHGFVWADVRKWAEASPSFAEWLNQRREERLSIDPLFDTPQGHMLAHARSVARAKTFVAQVRETNHFQDLSLRTEQQVLATYDLTYTRVRWWRRNHPKFDLWYQRIVKQRQLIDPDFGTRKRSGELAAKARWNNMNNRVGNKR